MTKYSNMTPEKAAMVRAKVKVRNSTPEYKEKNRLYMQRLRAVWRANDPTYLDKLRAKANKRNSNPVQAAKNAIRVKTRYKTNKAYAERTRAYQRKLRRDPQWREKYRIYMREWRAKNKEKRQALQALRRALKRKSSGHYTANDIARLIQDQKCICVYCQISLQNKYHVDHKTPLSRGGSNCSDNIQLLCPTCNLRKWTKTHDEFIEFLARENSINLIEAAA